MIAAAACFGVYTQALAATAGASASDGGLEEIVVTATRRETNLSNTPISLSALSAAEIERDRIVTMDDVSHMVPSLVFMPQSASETYLSIRGTSTIDDSTGTDQGVNMFVDDVVRTGVADLQPDLYDMERVEVLKGPQGTLFGRNSLGGTLSLYTKNPTFDTAGSAEASFGQNNLVEAKGMFNTPVIDNVLAARLVVSSHSNGGYINDTTTNTDIGKLNTFSGRAKLLYTPDENFRVVGGFDYLTSRGDAPVWTQANFSPELEPTYINGPTQTSQADPGKRNQNIWGINIRTDWTQPIGTLTSITGYRHLNALDRTLETGDPLDVLTLQTQEHDRQYSEEVRLASPVDQRLSWVAGIYYLNSDKSRPINGELNILDCGAVCHGPGGGFPGVADYVATQDTRTISYAGFIDGNFAITDTLKVDLGGRYTYEKKDGFANLNHSNHFFGPAIAGDFSHSWTAFTPKLTLTYKPVEEILTYATVSKGFQSGGFNTQGGDQTSLTLPFDSEYVWNYEVGVKFDGMAHRLQANASVFTDHYSNLQVIQNVTSPQGFFTATTNAGAARVDGIETDIQFAPTNWLLLGLRYDYLRSNLTKYTVDNGDGTFTSFNGNEVPFVAKNRVTASADLHTDLTSGHGRIAIGGDYSYRSPYFITAANSGDTPDYVTRLTVWRGLVNMHASWKSANERHEVALFAQNLTNIHYALLPADLSVFLQTGPEHFAMPPLYLYNMRPGPYQSIGITFREKF
ncbi:MAG: TonB-dependent receptor [Gammaproteobacteria bacterium]